MKNRIVSGHPIVENILTVKAVEDQCYMTFSSRIFSFPLDEICLYDDRNALVYLRSGPVLFLDDEYKEYVLFALVNGYVPGDEVNVNHDNICKATKGAPPIKPNEAQQGERIIG